MTTKPSRSYCSRTAGSSGSKPVGAETVVVMRWSSQLVPTVGGGTTPLRAADAAASASWGPV